MDNKKLYGVKDLKDAGAAMPGAGPGPYNPVTEPNLGTKYWKNVEKDLAKRYGKNGTKKNPAENRGNKMNKVAS